MYAITGITGNVGGAMANALLAAGLPVRAVVRDIGKGQTWRTRGCDVAVAEMTDTAALARAFTGTTGAFILPPPEFDPEPGYAAALRIIEAVRSALEQARPTRV